MIKSRRSNSDVDPDFARSQPSDKIQFKVAPYTIFFVESGEKILMFELVYRL